MKKKGALNPVVTAAILLVFLVVVFIVFFGEGLLPKVAEAGENLADDVLGGLRKDKFEKTELEIDKEVLESYENILNILRTGGEGPCILNYKPLTDDFEGYTISLSKSEEGIFTQLINKEGRRVETNTISGKVPCVVGEGDTTKNFYDNYLGSLCFVEDCPNDYSTVNIEFTEKDSIYVNGKKRDLEDQNLVFKTRDGNICFFPTINTIISNKCDANEEGLYDNCLENMKNRINTPYISFCG